jgi:hypothetical protein
MVSRDKQYEVGTLLGCLVKRRRVFLRKKLYGGVVAEKLFKCHFSEISIRLAKLLAYQLLMVGAWVLIQVGA